MPARAPDLLEVIDRKGLRDLGCTRTTVDHLFAALPSVALSDGERVRPVRTPSGGHATLECLAA
jgi:hypothetical protein